MRTQHVASAGILACILVLLPTAWTVAVSAGDNVGQKLYNGIVLPDRWPPKIDELTLQPMAVPYLENPPPVVPIDVGRQLFVDDFLIEQTTLKRTYHRLEPYDGNPILASEETWEEQGQYKGQTARYAMPYSDGVWYDPAEKTFKMWYMAALLQRTCCAVSKDGLHWEKPCWDVKPGTNVVDAGNRDSSTVWLDLEEKDPTKRYKMFRFQKRPVRHLVLQYSPDGIHWSDEITRAGKCHDRTTVFYNPFRKVWVASIKATLPPKPPYEYAARRYFEGPDPVIALQWGDYGDPYLWLWADGLDQMRNTGTYRLRIYNVDAVAYESIMLGMISILHGDGDGSPASRHHMIDVCLGFSRDGFHWHRPDRRAFIGVGDKPTDWNWTNVQSVGGCCLIVGDKLHFYYSGRNTSRKVNGQYVAHAGVGFIRRDGFASMDAGEKECALTTRPIRFKGKYLFVNVNDPRGKLRAEVLDENGEVITPFSRDDCIPICADSTIEQVRWKAELPGAKDLSKLSGKPVRLRFYLNSGSLYSFWVSPDESGASHGYVAAGGPGFTSSIDTVGSAAH